MQCSECDPTDNGMDADACPICLCSFASSPDEAQQQMNLGCSHGLCAGCLYTYAQMKLSCRNPVRCPCCAVPVSFDVLSALFAIKPAALAVRARLNKSIPASHDPDADLFMRAVQTIQEAALREPTEPAADEAETSAAERRRARRADSCAERAFESWSRNNHIKLCPSCSVPIVKNGGCSSMRCTRCQTSFRWDSLPLACPCAGYHYSAKPPFIQRCAHIQREQLPRRRELEFKLQKYVLSAPLVAVTLPVYAVVVPLLYLEEAGHSAYMDRRRRLQRRELERNREGRLAAYRERSYMEMEIERQRMSSCLTTGAHQWTSGWCAACGALTTDPLACTQP